VIKSQMEQTRQDLVEKVETLEQQVAHTVQEATSAVTNTVDAVKEVVSNTKEAVQSTVESVKETLDLSGYVQRSPWLMFGGAVMSGFALGKLLPPPPLTSTSTSASTTTSFRSEPREKQPEEPKSQSSTLSALASMFEKPLEIAEGMAVSAFFSLIHNVLRDAVPADWKGQLLGIVGDLNRQLGGLPLTEWKGGSAKNNGERNHAERDGSKVAGSVGSTDWQGEEAVGSVHRR